MRQNESGGVILHGSELLVAVASFDYLGDDQKKAVAADAFRLNEMMKADERYYGVIDLGGAILRSERPDTTVVIEATNLEEFMLGVSGAYVRSREESRLYNFFTNGISRVRDARKMKRDSKVLLTQLSKHQTSFA